MQQYIREAFAETMHATLVVLIDREREEQKNNDIATRKDLTSGTTTHLNNTESNAFTRAYCVRCVKQKIIEYLCLFRWHMKKQ